jgi:hypothetical protein
MATTLTLVIPNLAEGTVRNLLLTVTTNLADEPH